MLEMLIEMHAQQQASIQQLCQSLEALLAARIPVEEQGSRLDFTRGPMAPLDGTQSSGEADVFPNGAIASVIQSRSTLAVPGMATVHIHVSQNEVLAGDSGNGKLVFEVRWKTARGGGNAFVDGTRGQVFTVGGADSIEIYAFVESTSGAALLRTGQTKRVSAVVHWGTSVQPKPAWLTSQAIALVAGVPSTPIQIPLQARRLSVLRQTPAVVGTLMADFQRLQGATRVYIGDDPDTNQYEVVGGAEWVAFTSTIGQTIVPLWELAL